MITEEEKTLLIGCFRGDKSFQEAFIRRFSNLVYSTILQTYRVKVGDVPDQDLDDLHNTLFVRLLERQCRRLRQFKGKNGCSLASWVRVITVRTVIDYIRESGDALSRSSFLETEESLERLQADFPEPWERMEELERKEILDAAMASLKPRDRLFLKLNCLGGIPIWEVAAMLHITENNAYSLKNRSLRRLKAAVDKVLWQN